MRVQKRDGRIVEFDWDRILAAIRSAMRDTLEGVDLLYSVELANRVEGYFYGTDSIIPVEVIQNYIEDVLMNSERKDVAKSYILYRQKRDVIRGKGEQFKLLDDEFISKYKHLPNPMPPLGEFVYYRTYSRYLPEENRREYWWETVRRAVEYNCSIVPVTKEEAQKLFDNMFYLRQFLSGRTIWVGGTEVSKKYPMANFNCAFQTVDGMDSFVELLYLLMLGSGVGLRILKEDVKLIPFVRTDYEVIHKQYAPSVDKRSRAENTSLLFEGSVAKIIIGDSKNGWVDALKYYLALVSEPQYVDVTTIILNYDSVRPSGEKLKTFGGTASGHDALLNIFKKIDKVFKSKGVEKLKLKPIDCLDIANIIGEGVVVGGVRRSSEIALFDSDDEECINAKANLYKEIDGQWLVDESIVHRSMSNNSIFYKEKPTRERLHWQIEKMRLSGEPAFINEEAASKRRENFKGVNPCAEILLDSKGMCNLTTVNVMAFVKSTSFDVTLVGDAEPRELVTNWLDREGLFEAQYLSARAGYRMTCVDLELPKWNAVQKRDRLVGCSLTGWQDMVNATKMSDEMQVEVLDSLWRMATRAVDDYAKVLGGTPPLLVTTIKPEGTLSQLPVVSSGVHYSHSPYYIRRVRVNTKDPIIKVCEELGYPIKPEVGQKWETCKTKVVEFPVKAPVGKTKYDVSAIAQLENYKRFMTHYVDHNCSITVHVRANEWEGVEQWVWDNWDDIVAVSFLSLEDSFYDLLPYESITEDEYVELNKKMRPFVPSLISKYEFEESREEVIDTECSSGACPVR